MPVLGKVKTISLKVKSDKLFLSFIANGHMIFKLWSEIEDSPEHKNPSESWNMQGRRLKLTKFLSKSIPINNNALTRIHIAFRVNVLSITKVIGSRIDRVWSLDCIPLGGIFRTLVIAVVDSSMCPSMEMKIQKDVIDEAIGHFSTLWIRKWKGWIEVE